MSFRINMSKYYTSLLADAAPPAPVIPWYNAGGAPDPLAAYQPKGADDLADSYINIVNPGTYNAAPGVAPTWDVANGWIFNGTTQYLTTGIPGIGTYSVLIQFSGYEILDSKYLFGCINSPGGWKVFCIFLVTDGVIKFTYSNDNTSFTYVYGSAASTNGNIAMAGQKGYLNGILDATFVTGTPANTGLDCYISAVNFNDSVAYHAKVNIQAIAIYNVTLTAPQVLAVATRMAAL